MAILEWPCARGHATTSMAAATSTPPWPRPTTRWPPAELATGSHNHRQIGIINAEAGHMAAPLKATPRWPRLGRISATAASTIARIHPGGCRPSASVSAPPRGAQASTTLKAPRSPSVLAGSTEGQTTCSGPTPTRYPAGDHGQHSAPRHPYLAEGPRQSVPPERQPGHPARSQAGTTAADTGACVARRHNAEATAIDNHRHRYRRDIRRPCGHSPQSPSGRQPAADPDVQRVSAEHASARQIATAPGTPPKHEPPPTPP